MRELHEGIELLEEEREAGPFMWQNWDKWVSRCEEITMWIDKQMLESNPPYSRDKSGLVCGVEWPAFRKAVDRYRQWLKEQCGGSEGIKDQLVFAHNDTQYGNLLRIEPEGKSPLLLPANEHKQLIVIDFEYASANSPGLEFANHFTEWCYNYHDAAKPYALNEKWYPTPEEQHRFIKAYVQHQPFPSSSQSSSTQHPSQSPSISARPNLSHSISNFMLDSRKPPQQIAEEEKARDENTEKEVKKLIDETRMWRPANSAQWVAWGIVQAKVEGMDDEKKHQSDNDTANETAAVEQGSGESGEKKQEAGDNGEEGGEGEDEFDYLSYARERAMFFWGDVVQLGLIGKEELPEEMMGKLK
ncbi:MAG: hypothetical protein Q9183_007161, partial [Haloplaca sp. 2 TL-2023]